MSGQTIFMTGGSGYIGSTIIEFAIQQGYKITALSRTESSDAKLRALGATPIRGDFSDHKTLTQEAAKADIVMNLADALAGNYTTMSKEERFTINNAAIDALAEGLKGSNKPFIITSGTLCVAPDPDSNETDETAPLWPKDHIFSTDYEVRSLAHKEQGIRTCAIRLAAYVYGHGGSGVALFMNHFAQAGAGFYVDDGSAKTTTVHVEDAARLYLLLAQKGRAGEAYNASSETNVTQRQLAEAIGKALELPVAAMPFEDAAKSAGTFFAEFLRAPNRASNRKAREELRWEVKADKGILEEIASGSYVAVAKGLKKSE